MPGPLERGRLPSWSPPEFGECERAHLWRRGETRNYPRQLVAVKLAESCDDPGNARLAAVSRRGQPILPSEYYIVAVEDNGNPTLDHRSSGHLVLFAPDHAFEGVTPLPGCPPYSLMTIDDAPDLAAWLELCATAWSDR